MLYAITNRRLYGTNEALVRAQLLAQAAVWAANGVAYVQLREKDLATRDQVEIARAMQRVMRAAQVQFPPERATRLLINGRPDVALATGADGVHLPAGPGTLTPEEVRNIFAAAGYVPLPIISVSCHTVSEVEIASGQKVDCILFAPVFEKVVFENATDPPVQRTLPGTGLALLAEACLVEGPVPVYALGGVTAKNAAQCLRAGAAGIAAIRLMQQPASEWMRLL